MKARVRLNPQGLARKDKRLMSALVPPAGMLFGSADLAAGEPTCTAHYSQDKNYYDATFGMVGKAPYYDGPLLKIDNLYFTIMSMSPMGRAVARKMFDTVYQETNGKVSFAQLWQENPEYEGQSFQDYIKAQYKPEYAFHKMGGLGMGYSMGPRKFQNASYDAGFVIDFSQAKGFFNAYWSTFPKIRQFANVCQANLEKKGFLVNDFGYRLIPDKPYKAFNYWIQSTVSGIMHVLCWRFFELAPWADFLMVIHDEVIFRFPENRLTETRESMESAQNWLNEQLKWRVKIRVGFKTGKNLYEAK